MVISVMTSIENQLNKELLELFSKLCWRGLIVAVRMTELISPLSTVISIWDNAKFRVNLCILNGHLFGCRRKWFTHLKWWILGWLFRLNLKNYMHIKSHYSQDQRDTRSLSLRLLKPMHSLVPGALAALCFEDWRLISLTTFIITEFNICSAYFSLWEALLRS